MSKKTISMIAIPGNNNANTAQCYPNIENQEKLRIWIKIWTIYLYNTLTVFEMLISLKF